MSVDVNFKGTHAGTARGMDTAPTGRRITARLGGKLRSFTPADLIKGVSMAMRPVMQARQQKAFDEGMRVAKSRAANNALSAALLESNRNSAQSNARAIDAMFDAPATVIKNQPLLDALDGIVPQRAQALDDAIDGIIPAAPQSLSKFIEEL